MGKLKYQKDSPKIERSTTMFGHDLKEFLVVISFVLLYCYLWWLIILGFVNPKKFWAKIIGG